MVAHYKYEQKEGKLALTLTKNSRDSPQLIPQKEFLGNKHPIPYKGIKFPPKLKLQTLTNLENFIQQNNHENPNTVWVNPLAPENAEEKMLNLLPETLIKSESFHKPHYNNTPPFFQINNKNPQISQIWPP